MVFIYNFNSMIYYSNKIQIDSNEFEQALLLIFVIYRVFRIKIY